MKKIFRILLIIMLAVTLLLISFTYSSYKLETEGEFESKIGRWSIKVNGTSITENAVETIKISGDNFKIEENEYIKNDRIAPGGTVYYGLEIDPDNTDVSIEFTLQASIAEEVLEKYNFELNEMKIYLTKDGETSVELDCEEDEETKKYNFIIPVDKIKDGWKCLAKVYVTWKNDETRNDKDTALGNLLNEKVEIPVDVVARQYLGDLSNASN
jgi:hypothetical protein